MIPMNDAIVEILKGLGVRCVFGVSGANIEHLHDAIARRGVPGLTAVLAKTESSAAFMADGLARSQNTLGVCCSTSGGGMMNLAVGLGESFADRIPILALIGQAPDTLSGLGAFQDSSGCPGNVNAQALFGAMGAFVGLLANPQSFWSTMTMALKTALSEPMGPAILLVPRNRWDTAVSPGEEDLKVCIASLLTQLQSTIEPISSDQVSASLKKDDSLEWLDRIYEMLVGAQHPLAIIGPHISWHDAKVLDELFQSLSFPVATTLASLSHVSQESPNYLGVIGATGNPSVHRYFEDQCDLVLLAGTSLEVMHRSAVEHCLASKVCLTFAVDDRILPLSIRNQHLPNFTAIHLFGLLERLFANKVHKKLSMTNYERTWIKPEIPEKRLPLSLVSSKKPLLQSEVIIGLQPYLTECHAVFLDAGNCAAAAAHYLAIPKGVKTMIGLGMGGMGYAIAAAIGAKMGEQNVRKPSVVIAGDGAFMMNGLEIHTAMEYNLALLYLFFNNHSHGMCVTRQNLFFGGRTVASTYDPISIRQIAAGLDSKDQCMTSTAITLAEVQMFLASYFSMANPGVGVLDILIEQEEIPPFIPLNPHFQEINKLPTINPYSRPHATTGQRSV